jgi:histidinol-phosphate aminotransferase
MDINSLVQPHLAKIKTYSPVDPPEILAKRAGIPEDQVIKLNGNENQYGPSPKAVAAIADAALHVYPDPAQRSIRAALAEYTGLGVEHIVAGAGSDELIDLLFRLFVSLGDTVIDSEPTFGMYDFGARLAGANIALVSRDDRFDVDVAGVVSAAREHDAKLVFIASPNNPTGNLTSEKDVRELLSAGLIVVVDEAYYEFCGVTMGNLVPEFENLVVLRTMSKWAGLAGLRIGYGLMSPTLVQRIMDIKSPYNVNIAAEAALVASLDDTEELLGRVQKIVAERDRVMELLEATPGVGPWPSSGNFILCNFDSGRAGEIYDGLAARGIFVRQFSTERLHDTFRISIGSPSQNDALIGAMRSLLQGGS